MWKDVRADHRLCDARNGLLIGLRKFSLSFSSIRGSIHLPSRDGRDVRRFLEFLEKSSGVFVYWSAGNISAGEDVGAGR